MFLQRFCTSRPSGVTGMAIMIVILGGIAVHPGVSTAAGPLATDGAVRDTQLLRRGDPHKHGLTDADLDAVRVILRKAVDDHTVPGVSLLLAHKGEVIFKEAFGNVAVDLQAHMASSSKPVTATVVMILADQGKLSLDDPVEKYLPEFKGITIKGKAPKNLPTIRHLLCNMSGLPGDFLAESLLKRMRKGAGAGAGQAQDDLKGQAAPQGNSSGRLLAGNRSLADAVRELAKGGLATEPGAEFHYCTMGFNVAARIAEVAARRPFEDLSRTELLEPIGMDNTRYTPFGLQALNARPTLANGESRFIMAGGGMTSTLDDFAAFYQMHANGGTYRGHTILSPQAAATMRTRQAKLELLMAGPYGNDYGLAFFLDRLDKQGQARAITHPGLFGTTPWVDLDREVVGVFFVQSNFMRVMNLVHRTQAKVREIVPVSKSGP
jgi:CubicO group peptidase (beta-lactamase class C family)